MPSDSFCQIRFGDLLSEPVRNGVYKPKEFHGTGCKVVNMGELFAHSRLFSIPMKRVELNEREMAKSLLQKDDLLFARRSLVAEGAGKCCIVKTILEPTTFESSIIRARPNPTLASGEYLYYFFSSQCGRDRMREILRQVAVSGITGSDLVNVVIDLPRIEEQKRIASFLCTLDDKIALLRETNATLEAIAQALFKSWFVDFDPVRAKAEGRDPEGVPSEVADLFPNEFEDSKLGAIPKGWGARPIRDVVEAVFDGPHATPPESGEGPVFLGIKNFTGTQLDLSITRNIHESDWARWTKRVVPRGGDITFTYEAALGLFALIPDWLRCCLGRRIALVRVADTNPIRHYLFHYFCAKPFQDYLRAHTQHGSTVDRILLSEFPNYPVLWSSENLIAAFDSIAGPCWARIHQNLRQIQTLEGIRDALLPRIMSGKLRMEGAIQGAEVVL